MFLHALKNGLTTINKNILLRHITIVLIFSILYYTIAYYYGETAFSRITTVDSNTPHKNQEQNNKMSMLDCLYFSLVTQTTVGYGHIVPTHTISKVINILQLLTKVHKLLVDF